MPGYLRKNGIPYSSETTVMEYFDRFTEADGTEWFTVTTIVTDPVYLGAPFVTTTDFRKERDGAKWDRATVHGTLTENSCRRCPVD